MDMLYFGDTVPYSYPQAYKQGPYCDFNSACVYPPVGPVPNAACRFSSVPASLRILRPHPRGMQRILR